MRTAEILRHYSSPFRKKHIDIVQFLLNNGADMNKGYRNGSTPLSAAVSSGSADVVELLLKKQPVSDVDKLLFLAMNNGDLELFKKLLPNNKKTTAGPQLLHTAAKKRYLEIIDYLVQEKKVDVNKCIRNGFSPLYIVAHHGFEDVVKSLIKYGANINRLENGFTVLFSLVFSTKPSSYEMVRILLENGADINAKASSGFTPLHIAAISGRLDMFTLLYEKGADITAQTDDGLTPHDFLEQMNQFDILKYLKEN
ncbi:hypothetical protein Trydic_g19979 [Trypoxylus dichotomus]